MAKQHSPYVITPHAGLLAALGDCLSLGGDGQNPAAAAALAAASADVAIVVAGYTAEEEGEYIPVEMSSGREVVQLYVGFPGSVVRPHKLLRCFAPVPLDAGETRRIDFDIALVDLGWWDEASHRWQIEPGEYRVYIGADSVAAESNVLSCIN